MSKIIRAPHVAQRQGGYVFKTDFTLVLAALWCHLSVVARFTLSMNQHPVRLLTLTLIHAIQQPVPVRS
jgi:hypothetical protein